MTTLSLSKKDLYDLHKITVLESLSRYYDVDEPTDRLIGAIGYTFSYVKIHFLSARNDSGNEVISKPLIEQLVNQTLNIILKTYDKDNFATFIIDLYKRKNTDYGNTFSGGIISWGYTSALVRIEDKVSRLLSLLKSQTVKVRDESLLDTVIDLYNYSIMLLMELKEG